ncbi:hypothetical protein H310_07377 [Aphanomyces invadans]|uniref:Uncharacterized protein n=1 Tax=Aphanomyces invadans TaxID=157072 RepID=A0A024U364_9STRA|nr:hypothetical protein H310_07377 [Aphanomyces invadans]ETW00851.1 hypothetical protein H310_07377 [Aphanomyces invadans]|eukprot:XP_008870986.1 hypothetical protein H310_07377 [Aphanomyces invadans]
MCRISVFHSGPLSSALGTQGSCGLSCIYRDRTVWTWWYSVGNEIFSYSNSIARFVNENTLREARSMGQFGESMGNLGLRLGIITSVGEKSTASIARASQAMEPALLVKVHEKNVDTLARHLELSQDIHDRSLVAPRGPPPSAESEAAKLGDIAQLRNELTSSTKDIQGGMEFVDETTSAEPRSCPRRDAVHHCFQLLLDNGANHLDTVDVGNLALHLACIYGHIHVVTLVLRRSGRPTNPFWSAMLN